MARRCTTILFVSGLFICAASTVATSQLRAAPSSIPYVNASLADRPVEPTRFSPSYRRHMKPLTKSPVNNLIRSIRWSSWGGKTAVGSGEMSLMHGVETDSFLPEENVPVTVTFSGLSQCVGVSVYTSYSLKLTPGSETPEGWPRGQSGRFPCRIGSGSYEGGPLRPGACSFTGLHPPFGKLGAPTFTTPAWRPKLPYGPHAGWVFCALRAQHWGRPVTNISAVAYGLLHTAGRPDQVRPATLELGRPIWCPAAAGEEFYGGLAPITYSVLKLTLWGNGQPPSRRAERGLGHQGLKGRVYLQRIHAPPAKCQLGLEIADPAYNPPGH